MLFMVFSNNPLSNKVQDLTLQLVQSNLSTPVILLVLLLIGACIFAAYIFWRRWGGSLLVKRFFEIWRQEGISAAFTVFLTKIKFVAIDILKKYLKAPKLYKNGYYVEDNSEVVLYLSNPNHPLHSLNYQPRHQIDPAIPVNQTVKVSLIATVWNEGRNVEDWLKSIFDQTRLPDEIVITDAGSTDETVPLLQKFASQSPVPLRIIIEPKANIARGRNIAIAQARYDVIATTDFGCRLHKDWLEKLIVPFEVDKDTQVVAGMYLGVDENGKEVERMAWWSNKSLTDPKTFFPSARSSAFTRDIWKTIGGYPEWLTLTGEDTYYALELRKYASNWAFVPEAIAEWQAPESMVDYWKKLYHWSQGDGESAVSASLYWKLTLQVLFPIVLTVLFLLFIGSVLVFQWLPRADLWIGISIAAWALLLFIAAKQLKVPANRFLHEAGVLFARVLGFLKGARNRKNIEPKRQALIQGTVFILSGIPIDDTGGGARCTQIALELLRQKYAVVFINKYPKYESVDLNLSIKDANLFTYQVSEWNWNSFVKEHGWLLKKPLLGALVEMPMPEFVPIIRDLRKHGGVVVYDLLDEWNTTLGGNWYSEAVELETIHDSQILLATAPLLADRLQQVSKREVCLLPNAVNTRLFNPDRYYSKPKDFPEADWTAIYIGALWGEWFDWSLLIAVAKAYPEAAIVVIGDYQNQCEDAPSNLHFLGLKLQSVLPAYLAHADIAIIPWKVNKITQATSPLKVYEYLAMHKPVVSPHINPLQGIPGVFLAENETEFIRMVGTLRNTVIPKQDISRFVHENNWQARVACLLDQMREAQQNSI